MGRADLLRALKAVGEGALEEMAFALGYEKKEGAPTHLPEPGDEGLPEPRGSRPSVEPEDTGPAPARAEVCHWRVVMRERDKNAGEPEEPEGVAPPAWLEGAQVLHQDDGSAPCALPVPARLPLTRWSRLWPFLHAVLGQAGRSRHPDVPRIVRRVTRGEVLRRLPLRARHRWSPRIRVLLDFNRSMVPFWADYRALWRGLVALCGCGGLEVHLLEGEPGPRPLTCRVVETRASTWRVGDPGAWRNPEPDTPLMIVSDLGLLAPPRAQGLQVLGGADCSGETAWAWREFGLRLQAAGCRPVVLCPAVPQGVDGEMLRLFRVYSWDRHSRFQALSPHSPCASPGPDGAEVLLSMLAPALLIEPDLLRAARYLLPARDADAAAEAQVFRHPHLQVSMQACCFNSMAALERYQERFVGELEPDLKKRVVDLIRIHHGHLPASVRYAEMDALDRLLPGCLTEEEGERLRRWKCDIVQTCLEPTASAGISEWRGRHVRRQPASMWADNSQLAALWALDNRDRLAGGEALELPPHVSEDMVRYFMGPREATASRVRTVALRQRGDSLCFEASDAPALSVSSRVDEGMQAGPAFSSLLGLLRSREDYVAIEVTETGGQRCFLQPVDTEFLLSPEVRSVSGPGQETVFLDRVSRPSWASAIGRDEVGLWATVAAVGRQLRWVPPCSLSVTDRIGSPVGTLELDVGFWSDAKEASSLLNTGLAWPAWADRYGVDEHGLYADVRILRVAQRFRWLAPGSFLMGSLATEPEFWDELEQHEVTLSRGFWLADTACTQALWRLVMRRNPSRFTNNKSHPVEQVSWNDVQTFLARVNKARQGLDLRLPTEAEWEYACRAGTTTLFSFGDTVTQRQANYSGRYPYRGVWWGRDRQETVPVKALPPNDWGLYEMHGNVWEWCADREGAHGSGPVLDPVGPAPAEGASRVLRGGSWRVNAGDARSAYRRGREPAIRNDDVGFRLARS